MELLSKTCLFHSYSCTYSVDNLFEWNTLLKSNVMHSWLKFWLDSPRYPRPPRQRDALRPRHACLTSTIPKPVRKWIPRKSSDFHEQKSAGFSSISVKPRQRVATSSATVIIWSYMTKKIFQFPWTKIPQDFPQYQRSLVKDYGSWIFLTLFHLQKHELPVNISLDLELARQLDLNFL